MSELNLYNTLSRKSERFEPIDAQNVRMYVCGPTVYDFAHIGNARPVIVFDVLFRLLQKLYGENQVTYVRNITDVDDKINARALRDFPDLPLNEAIAKVTQKTADQFHEDVAKLGCLEPTFEPRATAHIEGMVKMINVLIDKGHAYVAQGAQGKEVLFSVSSMDEYGQLSNRKQEDQQAGARVEVEAHKQNASDFVLWKQSKEEEPGWSGDFAGEAIHGRPGWHIECSVMSRFHLGEVFDIHGGGLDLIFPHHENEIAQSRCAHGSHGMANYWMHNGYLQVEGKKMSKSEGNFITINELLDSDKFGGTSWSGAVLRLAMLMTHYREPIDFSVKRLEEASNILVKLDRRTEQADRGDLDDVISALCNDLHTSKAIAKLGELSGTTLSSAMHLIGISTFRRHSTHIDLSESIGTMNYISSRHTTESIDDLIDVLIKKRADFLKDKDFAKADAIRDELASQGIQLKDAKDPQSGERVTTWEMKR